MRIEVRGVHKSYRMGAGSLPVLRDVTLSVEPGEYLAITGPSGAGKSTLLHLLAGLDTPTQGHVAWDGKSLGSLREPERARLRNHAIGFVFQFYHLISELTALENVMLPGLMNGRRRRAELRTKAAGCLEQVGLAARSSHKPSQLSGGELQRVAIARALINDPQVLCCDEPTGNLDSQTGSAITQLLMDAHRTRRISVILVTHEHALAESADRWIELRDGHVTSDRPVNRLTG